MISIIVPVYNVKEYLQKCIESILAQTYKNYEVILVDDGSTDGSGRICDDYAIRHNNITVIHQDNKGLSEARNVGIRRASGEVLSFVDSDDWLESCMLEFMITAMQEYNSDIVICRGRFVNSQNQIEKIIGIDDTRIMSGIEATKEILKDIDIPSFAWNKIYKRTLFDGIEYPIGRLFEDTATTYKLFYKSQKVVAIPMVGYNYRANPFSITRQLRTDVQKFIKRELDNALAFYERYIFAKTHDEVSELTSLCAFKAYQMIRSFIHLAEHKHFRLTGEQTQCVTKILSNIEIKDLSFFNVYNKIDLILYKIYPPFLNLYLKTIVLVHPIEFEIK